MLDPTPSSASKSVTACRRESTKQLRLGKYELQGSSTCTTKRSTRPVSPWCSSLPNAKCGISAATADPARQGERSTPRALLKSHVSAWLPQLPSVMAMHKRRAPPRRQRCVSTYCCARASARRRKTANGTRSASADCLRVAPGWMAVLASGGPDHARYGVHTIRDDNKDNPTSYQKLEQHQQQLHRLSTSPPSAAGIRPP